MAKQSLLYPRLDRPDHTAYPASAQRRRRRPRKPPTVPIAAGPSSAVLSILATISAASVDASPLVAQPTPPPFLCPYIDESPSPAPLITPTPTVKLTRRGDIADRYSKGPDGKWRRVDRYTMYGSTVCVTCDTTSTAGVNDIDAAADASSSSSSSVTQTPDVFDANRPNGWDPPNKVDSTRTTIILSVSLGLAFIICMLMIAVTLWRRRRSRRPRTPDEELRLRNRRGGGDVQETERLVEKEARAKQAFFARAGSRWKAGVRSAVRRRRVRRHANAQPVVVVKSPAVSSLHVSQTDSVSRRQSTASSRHSSPPPPPAPSSPPAYPSDSPPRPHRKPAPTPPDQPDYVPLTSPSHTSANAPHYPLSVPDTPAPYDDAYHVGHVATDDKARLAALARMASAPPAAAAAEVGEAPVWRDEELEGVLRESARVCGDRRGSSSSSSGSSSGSSPSSSDPTTTAFPPPPPQSKMAAPRFYDYPRSFEEDVLDLDLDGLELEPEMGVGMGEPSAPPFEECPGAPEVGWLEMEASAPPVMEEGEEEEGEGEEGPSAPEWEWEAEAGGGQGHDRQSSPPPSPLPSSPSSPSLSLPSPPPPPPPAAFPTLPLYRA